MSAKDKYHDSVKAALPVDVYESDIKDEPIIRNILTKQNIRLIVYNTTKDTRLLLPRKKG